MCKILAIAAHPDDIELACAGTIIKHTRKGDKVAIVDLTEGELGTRGTVADRYNEAANAAKMMGVYERRNAQFRDGFFKNDEEHQLKLISYIRYYRPEIILANCLADRHPDHGRGGRLIADACFYAGLSKIETTWEGQLQTAWRPKRIFHFMQDRHIEPHFIIDISDEMEQKMDAIKCYKSQFHDPNSNEPLTYISSSNFLDNIKGRDAIFGKRIGVEYGEAFVCENIIGVSSLDAFVLPKMP